MPEIVEVEIQVEGLYGLIGDRLKDLMLGDRGEKIIRPFDEDSFRSFVLGKEIRDVKRVGKYIVMTFEDGLSMVTHLRMTGRYTINVPESKIGHTRVEFFTENGLSLRYSDVRLFGRISIIKDLDVLKKGADALKTDSIQLAKIIEKTKEKDAKRRKDRTVKELLTGQKVITGVGNVYANEILFRQSLYPGTLLSELASTSIESLANEIKSVLSWGYQLGGLSLKDYYHVDGTKGKAQNHLNVYKNSRCQRCLSRLKTSKDFDGRATYYCPRCQS
ncbi:formamidopyrimidine-DNA glycosylase [Bacillus phage SP-10]|uniref:formamidopyrimidine-DNA glycosylase n=1 Tax=Bacillus phage SP10 TaxID=941058 RepID=UPI0002198B58|nr:formamidopyrimidine-DNA glycosylase [Bacillus phage SP-10]BAK52944.1 formamidopyrimidine-DNA glycosylase [Bacillus phage SP-10]